MIGVGAKMAPLPDPAKRSADDPQLFTGSSVDHGARLMESADSGHGTKRRRTTRRASSRGLHEFTANARRAGNLLAFLGLALAAGLIGIIFAATRDAALNAGERPAPAQDSPWTHRPSGCRCNCAGRVHSWQ